MEGELSMVGLDQVAPASWLKEDSTTTERPLNTAHAANTLLPCAVIHCLSSESPRAADCSVVNVIGWPQLRPPSRLLETLTTASGAVVEFQLNASTNVYSPPWPSKAIVGSVLFCHSKRLPLVVQS